MYELITINCIEASNGAVSRLFHLVSQGIGTLEAESLSSYISRLAAAYSVKHS